jgi:hypothetical protein
MAQIRGLFEASAKIYQAIEAALLSVRLESFQRPHTEDEVLT